MNFGRFLKTPTPCNKPVLLPKVKWHAQGHQQFGGTFRLGKEGWTSPVFAAVVGRAAVVLLAGPQQQGQQHRPPLKWNLVILQGL